MRLCQSNREFNSNLIRSPFVLQNMSLNNVSLDLGPREGSQNGQSSLKELIQTLSKPRHRTLCVQCMNAPAFDVRRKAVRRANLYMETVRGSVEINSLRLQVR